MAKLTYCSFADDEKCRGVLILEGDLDPIQACVRAHSLKQNPGGQLVALSFDTEDPDVPPEIAAAMLANTNRLLQPAEAMLLFDASSIAAHEGESKHS